jgi:hypothetical protein
MLILLPAFVVVATLATTPVGAVGEKNLRRLKHGQRKAEVLKYTGFTEDCTALVGVGQMAGK